MQIKVFVLQYVSAVLELLSPGSHFWEKNIILVFETRLELRC